MAIKDLAQVERELKKQDRKIGNLAEEARRLRERIATATGISTPNYFSGTGTGGEVIAGAGLLGGGALPGTVTLNVYPGDGIEIVSDQVAVDLAAVSGLSFASGELQIDDSLAGAGLVISSKILAVGEGHGVDVTAGAVAVDESELDHALLGGVAANQHHDVVTLHADLNSNLLALSTQQLDLDTQIANLIFAGPTTGGAAKPTFRAMVADDLVAHTHSHDTELTDVSANDHHNQQHVLAGGDHTASGLTIGYVVRASGATTFVWAELQHGDLGGIGADDHHDPVTAGDGIDLTGQQVAVDVTDFIDTAYGLTESANNIRLNIGDGLEFDTGALEVDLSATSGLEFSSGDLQIADTIAGAGLTISSKILAVNVGSGLEISGDAVLVDLHVTWSGLEFDAGDLRVDLDVAFTWAGTHTFQADIQAECNLDFVGARSITTTADNLTLAPAADLTLNPGGNDVIFTWGAGKALSSSDYASQTTGWGISYGSSGGHADFRSMYADELHVQAFIADIYQASVGAIIITKSRGRLSRDFTVPANSSSGTLYIEDLEGWENTQLFAANDIVRLRYVDTSGGGLIVTDVWGVVTAYTDLAGGEQSYTFTTSDDGGVSGSVIYAGAIVLDYGQTASGSRGTWEATVLDTAGAPYSQVATWETNPWTPANWTARVRLGNLDGISGIGLEYGLWAGQNMTDTFLLLSDSSFEVHGLDIKLYDGASNTVRLDPATPSLALGSTLPTGFGVGDGIWMGKDTIYKFRVGDVDGERLAWDGTDLYLYADNNNYIKMTGSDLEFWSNATKTLWLDGDTGALFIDKMGDMLFSGADGLLLLGPPLRIEKESGVNYWYSTRKQKAIITGALHLETSRWLGTKALVVEEAATNLVDNPSIEVGTTHWTGCNASVISRVAEYSAFGDYSLKCATGVHTYAGVIFTPVAVAAATDYILSFYLSADTAFTVRVAVYDQDTNLIGVYNVGTVTATPQRFTYSFTTGAGDTAINFRIYKGNDATDLNFWLDGVQVEESAYATSYCDGSLGDGYAWTNGAHASTSTRAATQINLDARVGLVTANNTLSFRIVAQMTYDADATWPVASPHLMDLKGADNDNRIVISFQTASDKFYVYINGASRLIGSVQTFKAGDWLDIALTLDFANDSYILYIDGEADDSETPALDAPTLTDWTLGHNVAGNAAWGGFVFAEYSVLDRVLTATEVAQLYNLQRSLVDMGATNKPGIYILDGQFRLASSQTGARTEINPAGIFGENGDGAPTFTLLNKDTTVNSEALTAGDVLLGDNTASKANLLWDYSAGKLLLRVGTTVYTELDTSGVLYLGDQSNEHIKLSSSGFQVYDGATLHATYGATTTIGLTAGEHISITSSSVKIFDFATPYFELTAGALTLGVVDENVSNVHMAAGTLQLRTALTVNAELTSAGVLILGDDEGGEYVQIDTAGVEMYGGGVKHVELSSAGVLYLGDQSNEHIKLSSSGFQVYDGATLYATYGATTTIGLTASEHISISSTAVQIKDGSTVYVDLTAGALELGLDSAEHVLVNTSGVALKDGATTYGKFAATTTLGVISTEHISITSSALQLKDGASVYTNLAAGALTLGLSSAEHTIIDTSGVTIKDSATTLANFGATVTVGEVGASKSNVYITSGALQLRTNTVVHTELTTAGTFWAGDTSTTERIQWDTTNGLQLFNASNEAVIKFGTSGDALITGRLLSAASPAARIEISDNYIAGYSDATTKEFYLDASDGKAYVGGGNISLDATGITLVDGTAALNRIKWHSGSLAGTLIGNIYCDWAGGGGDAVVTCVSASKIAGSLKAQAQLQAYDSVAGDDVRLVITTDNEMIVDEVDTVDFNNASLVTYIKLDDSTGIEVRGTRDVRIGGGIVAGSYTVNPATGTLVITDGITAPGTIAGFASIYVDGTSGDLRVRFGDGTIKTIVTDT